MIRTAEIARQHARVRSLLRRVGHAHGLNDMELQAHWARYVCVVMSGLIETATRILFATYAQQNSSPSVSRYVEARLKTLQNPKSENIVQVATNFDGRLGAELTAYLADNGRKEAIDTVMSNRHLIAHGRDSGITIRRLDTYLTRVTQVIEYLEGKLDL